MTKNIQLLNALKFAALAIGILALIYQVMAHAHTFDVHCDPAGDYINDQKSYEQECERNYNESNNGRDADSDKVGDFMDKNFS